MTASATDNGNLRSKLVVVTRPQAQAQTLAMQLQAEGCAVELLPLLEILPRRRQLSVSG